MDFEDFLEPEIAVTAAITAAIFSPGARRLLRKGAVYGMAGILIAGDAVASLARNVGQGVQTAATSAAQATQDAANQARSQATTTESQPVTAGSASSTMTTQNQSPEWKEGQV